MKNNELNKAKKRLLEELFKDSNRKDIIKPGPFGLTYNGPR